MSEIHDSLHIIIPGICPPAPRPRLGVIPIRKLAVISSIANGGSMRKVLGCFRASPYPDGSGSPYRTWKRDAAKAMNEVRLAYRRQSPFFEKRQAVAVHLLFVMPLPKASHRKTIEVARDWCTSLRRGDADNLEKGPLDAAKGVLWEDDTQVARLEAEKIVGAQGESPRTEILIYTLDRSESRSTEFEILRQEIRSRGNLLGIKQPETTEVQDGSEREEEYALAR